MVTKRQNKKLVFFWACLCNWQFFLLMLIFTNSFKRKAHKMGKMIINGRARAVRMLVIVSTTGCTYFKSGVYFVININCFKYKTIRRKSYFKIIFPFFKCIILSIADLKQTESSGRNLTKP